MAADPRYVDHPDWREGRQNIERTILDGFLADREKGARIQLEYDGEWVSASSMTVWELEAAARRKATQAIERAMREKGDATTVSLAAPPPAERAPGVGDREGWAA